MDHFGIGAAPASSYEFDYECDDPDCTCHEAFRSTEVEKLKQQITELQAEVIRLRAMLTAAEEGK